MGHSEVWGPAGDRLMVVGLTGGIASGKTEVAHELVRLGALVVDADQVAREVTMPGTPVLKGLVDRFGEGILDGSGQLDRAALARLVFGDEEKLRLINSLTHPAIFSEIMKRVTARAESLSPDDVPAAVVDAALIVDVGASSVFDLLLVVTAETELRVARLTDDRGMSEEESRERIASQVPDSKRVEMADLVIENNGTLDELRSRVGEAWRQVELRSRSLYG
jgi:dephospho-CoA kinase